MDYTFNIFNRMAATGLVLALSKQLKEPPAQPVVVCIGSDLAIGDSLGPLTGSILQKSGADAFLYGTLEKTVTAREVPALGAFLQMTHPKSPVLAIDAAVGNAEEVGLVKLSGAPLYPGSGTNKQLGRLGDVSILGIVARREEGFAALDRVRLGTVCRMAEVIAEAVLLALEDGEGKGREQEHRAPGVELRPQLVLVPLAEGAEHLADGLGLLLRVLPGMEGAGQGPLGLMDGHGASAPRVARQVLDRARPDLDRRRIFRRAHVSLAPILR